MNPTTNNNINLDPYAQMAKANAKQQPNNFANYTAMPTIQQAQNPWANAPTNFTAPADAFSLTGQNTNTTANATESFTYGGVNDSYPMGGMASGADTFDINALMESLGGQPISGPQSINKPLAVSFGSNADATKETQTENKLIKIPEPKRTFMKKVGNKFGNFGRSFQGVSQWYESPYFWAPAAAAAGIIGGPIGMGIGAVGGLLISLLWQPTSPKDLLRLDRRFMQKWDNFKEQVEKSHGKKNDDVDKKFVKDVDRLKKSLVGTLKNIFDIDYKAEDNPQTKIVDSYDEAMGILLAGKDGLNKDGRSKVLKGKNPDFFKETILPLLAALDYKEGDGKTVAEMLKAGEQIDAPNVKADNKTLRDGLLNIDKGEAKKVDLEAIRDAFVPILEDADKDGNKDLITELNALAEMSDDDLAKDENKTKITDAMAKLKTALKDNDKAKTKFQNIYDQCSDTDEKTKLVTTYGDFITEPPTSLEVASKAAVPALKELLKDKPVITAEMATSLEAALTESKALETDADKIKEAITKLKDESLNEADRETASAELQQLLLPNVKDATVNKEIAETYNNIMAAADDADKKVINEALAALKPTSAPPAFTNKDVAMGLINGVLTPEEATHYRDETLKDQLDGNDAQKALVSTLNSLTKDGLSDEAQEDLTDELVAAHEGAFLKDQAQTILDRLTNGLDEAQEKAFKETELYKILHAAANVSEQTKEEKAIAAAQKVIDDAQVDIDAIKLAITGEAGTVMLTLPERVEEALAKKTSNAASALGAVFTAINSKQVTPNEDGIAILLRLAKGSIDSASELYKGYENHINKLKAANDTLRDSAVLKDKATHDAVLKFTTSAGELATAFDNKQKSLDSRVSSLNKTYEKAVTQAADKLGISEDDLKTTMATQAAAIKASEEE